jgi:hypothetical protein
MRTTVPAGNFRNRHLGRLALFDDPQLLGRRPSSPSFWPGSTVTVIVRSLICKSMSKLAESELFC